MFLFLFLVLGASEEERKHKLEGVKRKKTEDSGDSEEGTVVVCLLDSNIILAKRQSADMQKSKVVVVAGPNFWFELE